MIDPTGWFLVLFGQRNLLGKISGDLLSPAYDFSRLKFPLPDGSLGMVLDAEGVAGYLSIDKVPLPGPVETRSLGGHVAFCGPGWTSIPFASMSNIEMKHAMGVVTKIEKALVEAKAKQAGIVTASAVPAGAPMPGRGLGRGRLG